MSESLDEYVHFGTDVAFLIVSLRIGNKQRETHVRLIQTNGIF